MRLNLRFPEQGPLSGLPDPDGKWVTSLAAQQGVRFRRKIPFSEQQTTVLSLQLQVMVDSEMLHRLPGAGCAASKKTALQKSRLPDTRRFSTSRCSYIHLRFWPSALHGPECNFIHGTNSLKTCSFLELLSHGTR